ncbi:MAG: hypothetical protein JO266_04710 [Acidobacteria bacterium]|nr:hypothetical protein [Acidobacteriota bacterium]
MAAQAGFGLFDINERYFYLDRDISLDMAGISPGATHQYDRELKPAGWPAHPDGPYVLLFHDRDISLQHDFVERTFEALPKDTSIISMNHYVAILHAGIQSAADGLQLGFEYDEPYCSYFNNHSSSWRLLLADPLRDRIKQAATIDTVVDGRTTRTATPELLRGSLAVQIPAGMGRHSWRLTIR